MPKRKATAPTTSSPSNSLLNFFRSASLKSENASIASKPLEKSRQAQSTSESTSTSGHHTQENVAGTTRETALVIDDSDEDDYAPKASTPKRPRVDAESRVLRQRTPQAPPLAETKTNAMTAMAPRITEVSKTTSTYTFIIDDDTPPPEDTPGNGQAGNEDIDIIDDEFGDADIGINPSFDGDGSLDMCPICSRNLSDEDNPQLHVNDCLDGTSDSPGAGPSKPRVSRNTPPPIEITRPLTSTSAKPPPSSKPSTPTSLAPSLTPAIPSTPPVASSSSNLFSVLMSSYKDKMAWKQAELDHARAGTKLNAERLAQQKQRKGESEGGAGRRLAPFYKIMQGMPVAVDAFRYGKIPGVEAYLLTHFHSDHYTNLSSNWKNGPIYCSSTTASLVKLILKVDEKWVYTLPMDEPTIIPGTEVTVTLIEANHCPGSVLFLLEGRQTVSAGDSKSSYRSPHIGTNRIFRYLHCGDFRASPQHILHPSIKGKKIDICYLDTTYLNPKYSFPPQRQVIDACAALAKQHVLGAPKNTLQDALVKSEPGPNEASASVKEEDPEDSWLNPDAEELDDPTGGGDDIAPSVEIPVVKDEECTKDVKPSDRILVVVGTYSIGKERIVKGVAHALSSKIFVEARKQSILACQDDPELHSMLTRDPYDAQVHLVPLGSVNSDKIGDYLAQFKGHFSRVLAFRPTGWTYSPPAGSEQNINMSSGALNSLIGKQQRRTFLSTSLTPMRNSTWKHMLYGVPYSEHSSFIELSCFAMSLQCTKIIATVNVGRETGRARMNRWFETWERERKKRAERGDPAVVTFRSAEYW